MSRAGPGERAARAWGADPASARLVSRGVNTVFRARLGAARGACYLRLVDARERGPEAVEAALDYHRHAFAAGVPVCEPLPSAAGRWIERIDPTDETDATDGEGRAWLATAVAEVPGRCLETLGPDAGAWAAWGRSLGALHAAAATYDPGSRPFLDWDGIWEQVGGRLPPGDVPARRVFAELDAWQRALAALVEAPGERGLTHADLRAGNAFADGARVWLIDFDEPVRTWWAADVARPLLEGALGAEDVTRRLRDAFVAGYREARPLDERWVRALGGLVRAKALEIWSWILTCWEGERVPGGEARGAALARLRATFLAPLRW